MSGFTQSEQVLIGRLLSTPPESRDPEFVEQIIDIAYERLRGPDSILAETALSTAFESRWHYTGDLADWEAAIGGYQRLARFPELQLVARGSVAKLLGQRYLREEPKDHDLLRSTIIMTAELLADTPPDTAAFAGRASNLGSFLSAAVGDHLDQEIFEYANTQFRNLLMTVPMADSYQASLMVHLADMLLVAYRQGWVDDDTEAVDLLDRAAGQITGGPERSAVLRRVGLASLRRAQVRLEPAELRRALSYLSEAVTLDPDPWLRIGLATALSMRAQLDGSEADLRRAGSVLADLVPGLATGSEERLAAIIHWGDLQSQLADRDQDGPALDKAIGLLIEAVGLAEQGDDKQYITASRMNLGVALRIHARLSGRSEDLDSAIDHLVIAQRSAPDDRFAVLVGTRLGSALLDRYAAEGAVTDLRRAVVELEAAAGAQPPGTPLSVELRCGLALARAHTAASGPAPSDGVDESLQQLRDLRAEVEAHGHSEPFVRSALAVVIELKFRTTQDESLMTELLALTEGSLPGGLASANVPATAEEALTTGSAALDRYLSTGRGSQLDEAIDVLRTGTARPAAPELVTQLYDLLGKAMQHQFRLTFLEADLDEAISANRRAAGFDDPDQTRTGVRVVNLANALRLRFEAFDDEAALVEAAELGRRAVLLVPPGHPERARALSSLGHTLALGMDSEAAVDELVDIRRAALAECTPDDQKLPMYAVHLAHALMTRYPLGHADADLNEVTELVEGLLASSESEASSMEVRVHIADLLRLLLRQRFDDTKLRRAVALLRTVTTAVPDGLPTQISAYQLLAGLLQLRFAHRREVTDLGQAIQVRERLLAVMAPDHPARPSATANLGWALVLRARHTNTQTDLDAGLGLIESALSAIPPGHDDRPGTLLRLSNAWRFRYESGWGDGRDLASAIRAVVEAWQLPMTTPGQVRALTAGCALSLHRFQLLGDPVDLDEAVDTGRAAHELLADDAEDGVSAALGLAQALRERFRYHGSAQDIEEAIAVVNQAEATADRDSLRATARTARGLTWQARYERTGQLEDLERSIHELQAALELATSSSPERATIQQNLGIALHVQFQVTTEPRILSDAITVLRAAAASTAPASPARSSALANLGIALRTRFGLDRQTKDLQDAISVHEEAVAAVTSDSDHRVALTNLASTLEARAFIGQSLDADDLRSAVDKLRTASALEPLEHPMRCTTLSALGHTLRLLAPTDGPTLMAEAADRFREASSLLAAPPQDRVQAAHDWADAAHAVGNAEQSIEGFRVAVDLLPRMAWHGLTRRSREIHLARVNGLAPAAAAAATLVRRDHEAVELLEAGRSVLWTQALTFSAAFSSLAEQAPGLEQRLRELSRELSAGDTTGLRT